MSDQEVLDLVNRWVDAELKGDPDAFGDMLHDDFRGVGPVGFVLTKQQWADRHRGDLKNEEFKVEETEVRSFGDTAIVIAKQTQKTFAMGHESSGNFRIAAVVLKSEGRWVFAHLQFSGPLINPGERPPFAR